jgi:hypothetical protein
MGQDLGECIGQCSLVLLIEDRSRAIIWGCNMAWGHVKTSWTAWGTSSLSEGLTGKGGPKSLWQDSGPPV